MGLPPQLQALALAYAPAAGEGPPNARAAHAGPAKGARQMQRPLTQRPARLQSSAEEHGPGPPAKAAVVSTLRIIAVQRG